MSDSPTPNPSQDRPHAPTQEDRGPDDAAVSIPAAELADTLRRENPSAEHPLPDQPSTPRPPRPRIRSGAIVWGLIVCAAAVFLLAVVTSPANAAAFNAWSSSLGWGGVILVAAIALGAFILIMALLSVVRSAQRRRATL